MDKKQAIKIYALLIATTLKFNSITPHNIIKIIIDRSESGDTSPLQISLQPYKESVELFDNMIKLSEYLEKIEIENSVLFNEMLEAFKDMTEEEFIKWYRDYKKIG